MKGNGGSGTSRVPSTRPRRPLVGLGTQRACAIVDRLNDAFSRGGIVRADLIEKLFEIADGGG